MRAVTSRKRLIADRAARWVVSAGGIGVIASILGILIFILVEVAPLLFSARVEAGRKVTVPEVGKIEAVLSDDYRTHVATLDEHGVVRVVRMQDGKVVYKSDLMAPNLLAATVPPQTHAFAASTSDGRVLLKSMGFGISFNGQDRVVTPDETPPVFLDLDLQKRPLGAFAAQLDGDGNALAAAALADGRLAVARRGVEKNEMTGEATESLGRAELDAPGRITALVIDPAQKNLYAGTAAGDLLWWTLQDGQPGDLHSANAGAPITALTLLLGGRSLAVGQENGALSVWFPVNETGDTVRLARTHEFPRHPDAIRRITPSQRDRSFLAASAGKLGLYFSTADRTLWTGAPPVRDVAALFYTPKADGAYAAGGGEVAELDIHNPHPEITARSLFGKIWYEGYAAPAWVWQSSGGSDDFEPKLSLTPLLVGTLKGTFYSLLLAIPLGVFGAMYISQFMHPAYKRYVKPMVEIMASLPSVVLGFLAGLWLAPRIERVVPALVLMAFGLPLFIMLAGFLWSRLPRGFRGRFPAGTEALLFVFVLAGRRRPLPAAVGRLRALRLRGGLQDLAVSGHGARLRSAQRRGGGAGDGVRGDSDHLRDRRGRLLERSGEPGGRLARPRRRPLADGDPRRAPLGLAGHLLRHHDRLRPRRGRDDDRADGHRQHADHGLEPVQRLPHAVGEYRGGDPRGAARRHSLPHPVPGRPAAVRHHLPRQHRGRDRAAAAARAVYPDLTGERSP